MSWGRMILPMLPNSMTAVELRTLRLLAALPIFMYLMTKTDVNVTSLIHYLIHSIKQSTSLIFTILCMIYKFFSCSLLCTNPKFWLSCFNFSNCISSAWIYSTWFSYFLVGLSLQITYPYRSLMTPSHGDEWDQCTTIF